MRRGYFTFDGIRSLDYGVYISGNQTFNAAERDFTDLEIPGRDGTLTIDNGRFRDIAHVYDAFVYTNLAQNIENFRNAIMSVRGSARLTDSYHPDEFYRAKYGKGLEINVIETLRAGDFVIEFTRDPRRFLIFGEQVTTITANGSITNPTRFWSKPLIRVYGAGNLGVGSETITITYADGYTDIDCESQNCYKGTVNCNTFVELSGDEFPKLAPGANGIAFGAGITKVEITPRWYIL